MSVALTGEERAVLAERLGAAHVELAPCFAAGQGAGRPYQMFARCTVGDWSRMFIISSEHSLAHPGEARTNALKMFVFGCLDAAPHLFPVAA